MRSLALLCLGTAALVVGLRGLGYVEPHYLDLLQDVALPPLTVTPTGVDVDGRIRAKHAGCAADSGESLATLIPPVGVRWADPPENAKSFVVVTIARGGRHAATAIVFDIPAHARELTPGAASGMRFAAHSRARDAGASATREAPHPCGTDIHVYATNTERLDVVSGAPRVGDVLRELYLHAVAHGSVIGDQ
ncbi:MAG TPA: hypothetical protein VH743_24260 [Beijerinckiaceae bacterium]